MTGLVGAQKDDCVVIACAKRVTGHIRIEADLLRDPVARTAV